MASRCEWFGATPTEGPSAPSLKDLVGHVDGAKQNLVHVVVLVLGEPAHEVDGAVLLPFGVGERLVALASLPVLVDEQGIERIPLFLRILTVVPGSCCCVTCLISTVRV